MRYVSTRGSAPVLGFGDVLLAGLARDGGLYVPERWPHLGQRALEDFSGRPYAEVAAAVMAPFTEGTFDQAELAGLCERAYASFAHPAVTPLVQLGPAEWLLELSHGPTLAFKDVALQLVGLLFDVELTRRGQRVVIVGATSGDTGSAAIEAVRGLDAVDIVILYPAGRVSEVQRRQMTTVADANVHAVAVEGTFDDCQDLVKAMFADEAFRDRHNLSAVNSINWARVMAQVVYYVTAAVALGAPRRPVAFSVPTGNFGNVLAGWVARQMGLPADQLVVGSNRNDILTRFLEAGVMAVGDVHPTWSPSMDIQVSSNVERLLYEAHGRNGAVVAEQMASFRARGVLSVSPDQLAWMRQVFDGARVSDDRTLEVMAECHRDTGVLIDPHTAVGLEAARLCRRDPAEPMVVLSTAHPAKFPDAVERACGARPSLPAHLADLFERPERTVTLPGDLATVQDYVAGVVAARR